jgi:hypothetical protein
MGKIYRLSSSLNVEDKLLYASSMQMKTKLCPADSTHTIMSRWSRPLKVVGNPRPMTDFEWTVYSDAIVTEDVGRVLKSSGFSGFELKPVEFFSTTETPFGRDSLELKVTGWGGMASPGSGIRILKKCSYCGRSVFSEYTRKNNLFDIDKWDGSDVFLIWPMPRYIFVVEEVAKCVLNSGWSGVCVSEMNELPKLIAGTFTPGHIEDWYDKEKAAEILTEFDGDA